MADDDLLAKSTTDLTQILGVILEAEQQIRKIAGVPSSSGASASRDGGSR